MPEPTTSSMAGAVAAFKALGGTAAAVASGATLAAVVVMIMTPPRDKREWTVGLISTVVSSIGGGAVTVEHFQLHQWAFSTMGLCALGEVGLYDGLRLLLCKFGLSQSADLLDQGFDESVDRDAYSPAGLISQLAFKCLDLCNGVADKPPDLDEAWACALLPPMDNGSSGNAPSVSEILDGQRSIAHRTGTGCKTRS